MRCLLAALLLVSGSAAFLSQPETASIRTPYHSRLLRTQTDDDDSAVKKTGRTAAPPPGAAFALNPASTEAQRLVMDDLGLSEHQYQQLVQLSYAVDKWNTQINLISRKDCSPAVVFGRHVLPCIAAYGSSGWPSDIANPLLNAQNCVDVGTGGGFPGLPLAICYPNVQFTLLDSVGKKLVAVDDISRQLNLRNVNTHHGRAEELNTKFDVVTGRSVAALPQFCAWMQHLLKDDKDSNQARHQSGHLLYWTGGELDVAVTQQARAILSVSDLLQSNVDVDKNIALLSVQAVQSLARQQNEVSSIAGSRRLRRSPRRSSVQTRVSRQPKLARKSSATRSTRLGDDTKSFRRYDSRTVGPNQ